MSEGVNPKEKTTSLNAAFLTTVHSPSFPFISLKFVSVTETSDKIVEIKIPKPIFDVIKATQQTIEFPLILASGGPITIWSFDLTIATNILGSLGVMNNKERWVTNSQEAIANIIKNTKVDSKFSNTNALSVSQEILEYLGLLEATKASPLLFLAVTDLIERGQMDPDTIIYKVALGIYHSSKLIGKSLFPEIDDEATIYLKFIQVGLAKKFKEFEPMVELPLEGRSKTLKILICLLIAAFTYYSAASQK